MKEIPDAVATTTANVRRRRANLLHSVGATVTASAE